MTTLDVGRNEAWKKTSKKASMENKYDEATYVDGLVTMKTHEKI